MSDKIPPITVDETKKFRKEVKKLLKKYNSARKDIEPLIKQLESGEIPETELLKINIQSTRLEYQIVILEKEKVAVIELYTIR